MFPAEPGKILYDDAVHFSGYYKDPEDKNHLLIDEEAAAVVRDIFAWKICGMSNQGRITSSSTHSRM